MIVRIARFRWDHEKIFYCRWGLESVGYDMDHIVDQGDHLEFHGTFKRIIYDDENEFGRLVVDRYPGRELLDAGVVGDDHNGPNPPPGDDLWPTYHLPRWMSNDEIALIGDMRSRTTQVQ